MLIHKLVEEAWSKKDRNLLTRYIFAKSIQDARSFLTLRIENLSQIDLITLLIEYLRVNGYRAERLGQSKEMPIVMSSFSTADRVGLTGYGAAMPIWTDAHLKYLEKHFPTADYYHLLAIKKVPTQVKKKVKIVKVDQIIRILLYVFVFEYFFEEYFHSILTISGFREYMFEYLEQEIGLSDEQIETLSAVLEKQYRLPMNPPLIRGLRLIKSFDAAY